MPKIPNTPRANALIRYVNPEVAAKKLGVTVQQVLDRRKELGLATFTPRKKHDYPPWTPREDKILLRLSVSQAIPKLPNRTPWAIIQRRRLLRSRGAK